MCSLSDFHIGETVYPDECKQLEKEIIPLDEELDKLREDNRYPYPLNDRIRALRKEIAKLEKKSREIWDRANPKFIDYWFVQRGDFKSVEDYLKYWYGTESKS